MNNQMAERQSLQWQRGFTLLEIMIVVVIIGVIASIAIVNFVSVGEGAKIDLARTFVKGSLSSAIQMYQLNNNTYPNSLDALLNRPSDASNWRGPYLKEAAIDPWGEPYQLRVPGTHNTSGFDVWSKGPDKQDGSGDDIGNWNSATGNP